MRASLGESLGSTSANTASLAPVYECAFELHQNKTRRPTRRAPHAATRANGRRPRSAFGLPAMLRIRYHCLEAATAAMEAFNRLRHDVCRVSSRSGRPVCHASIGSVTDGH